MNLNSQKVFLIHNFLFNPFSLSTKHGSINLQTNMKSVKSSKLICKSTSDALDALVSLVKGVLTKLASFSP